MAEPSPVPPINTFIVCFWQEWSAAGPRWRGRIEHVQSGESAAFLGLEGMLDLSAVLALCQTTRASLRRRMEWEAAARSWADRRRRPAQVKQRTQIKGRTTRVVPAFVHYCAISIENSKQM
jgi:hypothetical protein